MRNNILNFNSKGLPTIRKSIKYEIDLMTWKHNRSMKMHWCLISMIWTLLSIYYIWFIPVFGVGVLLILFITFYKIAYKSLEIKK